MTILLITSVIAAAGALRVMQVQANTIADLRGDNAAMAETIVELRRAIFNWLEAAREGNRIPAGDLIATQVDERRHFSA